MTQQVNHKPLILTGCLLWIASFFGEVFSYQPYSTIGIIIAPILTSIGLFYWFKFYKSTRGHYPKFWATYKHTKNAMYKNPFAGMELMFRHILEFWTFLIVFWMGLILIIFLTFRQSDAFEATKRYCENDKEILSKTGKIRYYGVLVGGKISTQGQSGNADLSFTIIGEKGNFLANSELTKSNDEWTVESLTVR